MRVRFVPAVRPATVILLLITAVSGYPAAVTADSSEPAVKTGAATAAYAPTADPMAPVVVGPQSRVGRPGTGEKVARSVLGGLIGATPAGTASPGARSTSPATRRDPTRKQDYATIRRDGSTLEAGARARFAEDSLLVSAGILASADRGTFQTVFLQSCDGRRLYPQGYEIYELWSDPSLSVSWSKTASTGGQAVSRESGSWGGDRGRESGGIGVPVGLPATWQQLGFSTAYGGARSLGIHFSLLPPQLSALGEVSLFVHVTRPGEDPVTTEAFNWLLSADADGQVRVAAPDSRPSAGAATRWQGWSERCAPVAPVRLAAAGGAAAVAAAGSASPAAAVTRGPGLPAGISTVAAKGTGRTTGHIADITLRNDTASPVEVPLGNLYIPSGGQYQSYVVAPAQRATIAANASQVIPVQGFCTDVHRPPVPAGHDLPPAGEWWRYHGSSQPLSVPPRADAAPPGRALIPGTGASTGRRVDTGLEPEVAVPLLLEAIAAIESTVAELKDSGRLKTPFSGNPEREREAVIQQTFWLYAAELTGEPYTREDFGRRLEAQQQERTGVPAAAATEADRARLQQGTDDFWDAFELVGVEAKIISSRPAGR